MPARLVQALAVIAAAALAIAGAARLRSGRGAPLLPGAVRRWTRAAARTVSDDVESLFI